MNWRNKISIILDDNSYMFHSDIGLSKKIVDKCKLKYAGSHYRMLRMPNDINTIKKYVVGKTTYKVTTSLETNRNGWVGKSYVRTVQKRLTYGSFDMVPKELRAHIDWRARRLGCFVWDFVSYSNSSQLTPKQRKANNDLRN